MKKIYFISALLLLVVGISCTQEDLYIDEGFALRQGSDGVFVIKANNVLHFSNKVTSISATITRHLNPDEYCIEEVFNNANFCCCGKVGGALGVFEEITIGETSFNSSGFTMELSTDIPDAFLRSVTELECGGNLTISNRQARIVRDFEIIGHCRLGERVGRFEYKTDFFTLNRVYVSFVFSDRDVAVSGTQGNRKIDLSLAKGWNMVYNNSTTQRPTGLNFIWTMPAFWEPYSPD